jgi:hypothetical protein
MKRIIIIISAVLLVAVIALVLCLSFACKKPKTLEEAHDILYEWLIDNGKLEGGTKLSYSSGSFILTADSSKNITVYYSKGRFDGFSTAYELPLFPFEEKTEMKMTLTVPTHSYRRFVFDVSFSPSSFKNNVPLSYDLVSKPAYETIHMPDYGTSYYKDGKFYFELDPDKADEYYALKKHNEEIDNQTKKAEKSATETSHAIIADILSWLESDICKSAGLTLSELGYKEYK